jgi:hypothetical protein
MTLMVEPAVDLIELTSMCRITHRWVDFMNEDVIQALTDRHDLVPCQRALSPAEKLLQPNAEIRRRHWHGISTSVAGTVLSARFCLGPAVGWVRAGAALVRALARPVSAFP